MASYTTNLNLKKPAGSENVAIGDINNNMDTIDQAYGTLNSKINGIFVRYETTISTSSSGNALIDSVINNRLPICAFAIDGASVYSVVPVRYSGSWYIHVSNTNGSAVEVTNLNVHIVTIAYPSVT